MVWLLLLSNWLFGLRKLSGAYERLITDFKGKKHMCMISLIRLVVSWSCLTTSSCSTRLDIHSGNSSHMPKLWVPLYWRVTISLNKTSQFQCRMIKIHTQNKTKLTTKKPNPANTPQIHKYNLVVVQIKWTICSQGENSFPSEQLTPNRSTLCRGKQHTWVSDPLPHKTWESLLGQDLPLERLEVELRWGCGTSWETRGLPRAARAAKGSNEIQVKPTGK